MFSVNEGSFRWVLLSMFLPWITVMALTNIFNIPETLLSLHLQRNLVWLKLVVMILMYWKTAIQCKYDLCGALDHVVKHDALGYYNGMHPWFSLKDFWALCFAWEEVLITLRAKNLGSYRFVAQLRCRNAKTAEWFVVLILRHSDNAWMIIQINLVISEQVISKLLCRISTWSLCQAIMIIISFSLRVCLDKCSL